MAATGVVGSCRQRSVEFLTPAKKFIADSSSVSVTYYDFRNNTSDSDTLPTDYLVVHCDSGSDCAKAGNYGDEIRLTRRSLDMEKAPVARGYFTGDYEGLANDGPDFTPFFSQTPGGDPASVFFRRVGP